MAELSTATAITTVEDGDLLPVRKAAAPGLLKMTMLQVFNYLFPSLTGRAGDVLAVNGTEDGLEWIAAGGGGGGIPEAPIDGTGYVRKDGDWEPESGGAVAPSWSYGNGFRANVMGITSSGGSTNSPYNLLMSGAANQFFWANGSTTKTLQFEFPTANRLTGIAFLQSGTNANGTWTLSGSNDGSAWTDIITDYVLGGTAYTPYAFTGVEIAYIREFTNATAYKYYRLVLNGGQSTSSTPYVRLMLLKCQPI